MNEQSIEKYLVAVATTIDLQLQLCTSDPKFSLFLDSPLCRGYLLGFLDAAIQRVGICGNQEELLERLVTAHMYVFSCESAMAREYLRSSLSLQDNAEFAQARNTAGDELSRFLDENSKNPIELLSTFKGMKWSEREPKHTLDDIFGDADRRALKELSALLHQTSGLEAFFDFRPVGTAGKACAFGVIIGGKKLMLASLVGSCFDDRLEYTMRNFQNEALPGLPASFESLVDALVAHKQYLLSMVQSLRRETKPWWKQLF